ncbi:hypothetical protein [Sphaerisporangium perillae]|uniref:hypothetical protein n=1 Tax=Sphaerisporangium perillae TaxID=2935860 RepID=UPI00200C7BA1|nr:hypothetical protein [Sphaerisporangium perillae]
MRPGDAEDAEDERALSPEEMLRIIESQRAVTARRLGGDPPVFYVVWGLAWLVGFGAFFLHYGLSGRSYAPISVGSATAILFAAMALAIAITSYVGWKQNSQVRGVSQDRATMYGLSWFFAFFGMGIIGSHFDKVLPPAESGLLWASLSVWIVSILFMAGAAVWRQPAMFFVGVWIAAVNMVGVPAGPGWHALLVSAGVGGGFIAIGAVLRVRLRPGKA